MRSIPRRVSSLRSAVLLFLYMDVRKRFLLSMVVLLLIATALGVFVYRIGTGELFEEPAENGSPIGSIPLDITEVFNTTPSEGESVGGEGTAPATPPPATITIDNAKNPKEGFEKTPDTFADTDTAVYTVSLRASWSEQLHPDWFPSGAHLSPMVAWSHGQRNIAYSVGAVASDGMELMAETGGTGILEEELEALTATGYVFNHALGSVFDAPGEVSVTLRLSKSAGRATVVSMIAPSPDWFIAVQNIPLFEDGVWLERKEVVAALYDAGTDSGTSFRAFNRDTSPAEPITSLAEAPRLPIATFTFERQQ